MNGFTDIVNGFSQVAVDALKTKADDLYTTPVIPPAEGDIYTLPSTAIDITNQGALDLLGAPALTAVAADGTTDDSTALNNLDDARITNWYIPTGKTILCRIVDIPARVEAIYGGGGIKAKVAGTGMLQGAIFVSNFADTHLLVDSIAFTSESIYTPDSATGIMSFRNGFKTGNVEVRNCTFTGNAQAIYNGLGIVGDWANGGVANVWAHNNNFIDMPASAIYVLGREFGTAGGSEDDRSVQNINIYNNYFDASNANNNNAEGKNGWHCGITYSAARGGSKCYNNRFVNHKWDVEISDGKDVEMYNNYSTGTTEYFVFYNGNDLQYPAAANPVHHNHFDGADTGNGCRYGINILEKMPLGDIYENFIKNGPINQQDGEAGIIHDNTLVKDLTLPSVWGGGAAIFGYLDVNTDSTVSFYANDIFGYGSDVNIITFQAQVTADVSVTNNNVYSSGTGCIQTGTSATLTNNTCDTGYTGSIPTERAGAGLSDPANIGPQ